MSKTRKINLICLFAVLVASLFIGTSVGKTVKADATAVEPVTFEMVDGASVRLSDGTVNGKNLTNGMRFQIKMDAKTVASIDGQNVKLYAFIAPVSVVDLTSNDKVAAAAKTIESHKNKWLEIAVNSIYTATDESGKEYHYANAVICNLTSAFYNVQFNAVAIIDKGGVYTYAKAASTTRSIYDVVNSAVLDKYADRLIGGAENTKLDYANWYGQGEYPVSPKTAAQYAKYNELKETTLKNLGVVRQDVLVDNPTVTIGENSYSIKIPSEHGEQEVSVTVDGTEIIVPVTIIDAVLTAENLKANIQSQGAALSEGKYFVLDSDIDASGIDWKADMLWTEAKGFKGTIDGRGYTVKNLNIENGVPGIFNCTQNAVVKNINFTVANFVPQGNKSVFGVITADSIFENINVTFNCIFDAKDGGILSGHNAVRNTYKNVKVMAEGSEIYYLVCGAGHGSTSNFTDVTVYADKVNFIYGTVKKRDDITVNELVEVNLTGNRDILMTDKTYSLNLGDEQTGLTVTSILCDGKSLGTDLSNLDLSAFKSDYAKHGEKTIVVKGVKGDSKIKINVPVTFVTKMIKNENDLRTVVTTITDSSQKSIFGYYKLESDINYSGGFYNSTGYTWTNANNGFRGTLDGNGKTITGFAHFQGLFFVVGNGAVIKNVNLISTRWAGNIDRLLGAASYGATYEDVTIIMKSSTTPCAGIPTKHLLFADKCQNNTFTNVTVKVYSDDGITLGDVTTVFGNNFTDNKCSGVKIYCKSLAELGKDSAGSSIKEYKEVTVYNTEG